MKELALNKFINMPLPEQFKWTADQLSNSLSVHTVDGLEVCSIALLSLPLDIAPLLELRQKWCHDTLIEYLEHEMGPPFSSSVEEIAGKGWLGYQSITALGSGAFQATRCVIGNTCPAAVRITFQLQRDRINSHILEVVEGLSMGA